MRRIRTTLIIQLLIVLIYLFITLFSITIQPINLILGLICILIIPGYNLLEIFKPQSTMIQKIGYIPILSLAIGNISMLFSYLFIYDLMVPNGNTGVIFGSIMLITSLQILNLILILINEIILFKRHKRINLINTNNDRVQNYFQNLSFIKIFSKVNLKSLLIYLTFFLSIIFLCLSTSLNKVSDNNIRTVYEEYKANFLFFSRVSQIFYIFLPIVIISLVSIIFFTKNKYLVLFSISIFLYTLWILPYLQIGNFFTLDSEFLYNNYQIYLEVGFKPAKHYSLTHNLPDAHRYSTGIFTTILLVAGTHINITPMLWYVYPICFLSIPFFFYYIFQNFSNLKPNKSKNFSIFIITIIAIVSPQFIKYGHSATTGVFGTYIFFILILEFYFFTNKKNFEKNDIIFLAFLFFFLAITHTEECVYFLILIFLFSIFQIIIKYNNTNINDLTEIKKLRKYIMNWVFFLLLFSLIFYFTQEFFGWIPSYISMVPFRGNFVLNFIFNLYSKNEFTLILGLHNTFTINYILIFSFSIGILLFYFILYIVLTNFNKFIVKLTHFGGTLSRILHKTIVKITSKKKPFLALFLFIIYLGIIIFDLFFFNLLIEKGILLVFEILLNSIIFVISIIMFLLGVKYYKIKNQKQNYFLLVIACSSLSFCFFIIIWEPKLIVYTITRFFSYFIFFNLIIVQNTSFRFFIKKKKIYIMMMVTLLLFIGFFYSLRTLSYG